MPVQTTMPTVASINGRPLQHSSEQLDADTLRQRAYSELLRQEAQASGLLHESDNHQQAPADIGEWALSEAASQAIEQLLEQALSIAEPDEAACRRHHAAQQARYTTGERVNVRHILFAVVPGVDVSALRKQAETSLLEVRCHDNNSSGQDRFSQLAAALSNCPSGADGGSLGWLSREDCAPEFAKEIFGHAEVGVLPRLVHSRFGLHVIEVLGREPGTAQSFESVKGAVRLSLQQQSYVSALRQYLQVLAGNAVVLGVDIDAADSPLVQ